MSFLNSLYDLIILIVDQLFSLPEALITWLIYPDYFLLTLDVYGSLLGASLGALNDPFILPYWLKFAILLRIIIYFVRWFTGAWQFILSLIPFVR